MMLDKLQRRDRIALTVGAVGVGLFLVFQFIVFPLLDSFPQTSGGVASKELTLRRYQRLVRESAVEQARLNATRERLKTLESSLVESPSASLANAEWQRSVRELADSQGVELGSSEFLRTEDLGGGYSLVEGRVTLRCRLEQWVAFMVALADSSKLMAVRAVKLRTLQGDPQNRLNVELTIGVPLSKAKLTDNKQEKKP
jgi:Type II secretion system (T2SS), protein M subtype b